jgi:hypothetical protein
LGSERKKEGKIERKKASEKGNEKRVIMSIAYSFILGSRTAFGGD